MSEVVFDSFVNLAWIIERCENAIQSELMRQQVIGPQSTVQKWDYGGYLRALRELEKTILAEEHDATLLLKTDARGEGYSGSFFMKLRKPEGLRDEAMGLDFL